MAAHQGIFSLQGHKLICNFCLRNSYVFKNNRLILFGLLGIRFKSLRRNRNGHYCSSHSADYEMQSPRVTEYDQIRENSQRLRRLRNDYFSRASQAYSSGQHNLAHILSQKGRMMNNAIKHSEVQSFARILEVVNAEYKNQVPTCSKTLNVHGLHAGEAIEAVDNFLYHNRHQKGRLKIITGWGKNSYLNKVRLLPALKNFLQEQGKLFEEVRPGVLEVIT